MLSKQCGQSAELRILQPRLGDVQLEQPERLGHVLEEVSLPLDHREKAVGAERLHVPLETAGDETFQERLFVKRVRLARLYLGEVIIDKPLANRVVGPMV